MKIVKMETVAYDPSSKILTISGVNRFSKKKTNSVFIEDEAKFIEILHHLLANSTTSSINYANGIQPTPKKVKKKNEETQEQAAPK
ncbi:hypothetical protein [Ochrobactrum teleogrylli]